MSADTVRILLLTAFFFGTFAAVVDIRDFGAVANLEEGATVIRNQKAINFALSNLTTGDTLLIPSGKFFTIGGIQATGLNNVSLRFDGDLVAVADFSNWVKFPLLSFSLKISVCTTPVNRWSILSPFHPSRRLRSADRHWGRENRWSGEHLVLAVPPLPFSFSLTWRAHFRWEKTILPQIFGKLAADRPKLFVISQSQNILVENITLHSSP